MASPAKLSKRTTTATTTVTGSNTNSNSESWGMGFLLVFFPQQHGGATAAFKPVFKRSNSVNLLSKAQSTISVCAVVIFFTLLLFTLSNFEPNNNIIIPTTSGHYRRHLSQSRSQTIRLTSPALQKLGTLYSRGTKSMNDIVICHVPESTTPPDLKSFLRAFHRSGLPAKSDLLFLFPAITTPEAFDNIIHEENRLFLKLIHNYKSELAHNINVNVSDYHFPASFDITQFVKSGKSSSEPIWGRKIKSNVNMNNSNSSELTRLSYGSVVGFGVGELDPENALSGFVDHVLISQRRWAAYPMLLGRLRRNYKHVTLVDVKDVLIMGDPLAGLRNCKPESVFLSSKHSRKPTDKILINPSLITGGARGVRRLSAAMLTEIVRSTTTTHKKKIPATESALLSRLVANELVQKSVNFVVSGELIPEASSLGGVAVANIKGVVRRGNSNVDIELTKRVCSFAKEASVYNTDCRKYNFSSV
ncbi:uncharacterized protein LOC143533623 [Bidens hawaiensis]|uniref:uncharacterized protein LOC143533623 n=1 Tax=Bidens hawaiensis TaxID=980011 RepID=UPI00404B7182